MGRPRLEEREFTHWRWVAREALRWRREHGATWRALAVIFDEPEATLRRWCRRFIELEGVNGAKRPETGETLDVGAEHPRKGR